MAAADTTAVTVTTVATGTEVEIGMAAAAIDMVATGMETGTVTGRAAGTTGTITITTTPRELRPRQHRLPRVLIAHHRPPTTRRSTRSTTPRILARTHTRLTVATLRMCSTTSSTWPQRKPNSNSKAPVRLVRLVRLVHKVPQHLHRRLHQTTSLLRRLHHPIPHRLLRPQGLPRAWLAITQYVPLPIPG